MSMDGQEIEVKLRIRFRNGNAVSCSIINSEKQEPQVGFEPTTSSLPRTRDTPMPLRRVCDNNIGQDLT